MGVYYMESNITVYNNDLNNAIFKNFLATDTDIFFACCLSLKDKGAEKIELSFAEIRKLANYRNATVDELYTQLKCLAPKISAMTICRENDDEFESFVLFPTFRVNKKKQILTVGVNRDLLYILNNLTSNFSLMDLSVLTQIRGNYAKTLYRYLVQMRNGRKVNGKHFLYMDIDDFGRIFEVPQALAKKYYLKDIIKPAISSLTPYVQGLSVEPYYLKQRGKPLGGFYFYFDYIGVSKEIKFSSAAKSKKSNFITSMKSSTYDNLDDFEKSILSN